MTASVAMMADQQEPERSTTNTMRKCIGIADVPATAMTWSSPGERARSIQSWRNAIGRTFPEAARVLRVAWALEWLFGKDGFAYPTDGHLERELLIPVKKIQAALQDLERAGAIIRATVMLRGRAQRRIWPSKKIVESTFPTAGKVDTPHGGPNIPPTVGGQNTIRRTAPFRQRRISSTADDAKRAAELREARDRERGLIP